MAARIFLGITAAVFIGYGLVCLASPEVVANATGMNLATSTASVEVRAMYGGLQTAVGLLAALAHPLGGLPRGQYLRAVRIPEQHAVEEVAA